MIKYVLQLKNEIMPKTLYIEIINSIFIETFKLWPFINLYKHSQKGPGNWVFIIVIIQTLCISRYENTEPKWSSPILNFLRHSSAHFGSSQHDAIATLKEDKLTSGLAVLLIFEIWGFKIENRFHHGTQ